LIRFGSVKRGQLGISISPVTPDVAEALGIASGGGALVTQVVRNSPAARAGIRAGDVVTALSGRKVKSASELRNAIGMLRVGEKIEVTFLRDRESRKITAEIADPADTQSAEIKRDDGSNLPEGSQHRGFEGALLEDSANTRSGVIVRAVSQGSRAANAGLRVNDVIITANGTPIGNRADLSAAWRAAVTRGVNTLVLQVRRGGELTIVLLR
jgi:S1-C subfamily serine protease